jgi:hypothetical protein
MLLNEIPFNIYLMDTVETIEKRIAAKMRSLVKWLIFDKRRTLEEYIVAENITVIDYLSKIYERDVVEFPSGPIPIDATLNEAKEIFIASNRALQNVSKTRDWLLLSISENLRVDAYKIFNDQRRILTELNARIDFNQKESYAFESHLIEFENVPNAYYTPYEMDHLQFTINYGSFINGDVLSFFNEINVNEHVPYICVTVNDKSYYKIYRGTKINAKLLEYKFNNTIFLIVNSSTKTISEYSKVIFSINNSFELIATHDMKIGSKYISKEEFLQRLNTIYSIKSSSYAKESDNFTIVYFTYPNECFDVDIFSDIIMNDKMFNSLIVVDEFARASKLKQNLYIHILGSNETMSLFRAVTTKYNQYEMREIGSSYIKCRLKAESTKRIDVLQKLFGKFITLYNNKKDAIISQYVKYLPAYEQHFVKCKKIPAQIIGLRNIAPEVFVPRYSRKCAHRPIIISDEEAKITSRQVMKFPIKDEQVQSRNYVCPTDAHPYIGLRMNDLDNKLTFPYLPCCFAKDQNKPGTIYKHYFYDVPIRKREQIAQLLYSSKKILNVGTTGMLPDKLNKLFDLLDTNPNHKYYRRGIGKSSLSSIEAILVGQGKINSQTTESAIISLLSTIKTKIETTKFALAAKQELYDQSIEEILIDMRTKDLRPSKYVRLLELALKCNIFIFTPDNDGSLIVPPHIKSYYKYKPRGETFFLYEQYDDNNYQTELILRKYEDQPVRESLGFLNDDAIVKGVYDFFTKMTGVRMNNFNRLPVVSQFIDLNGKCRIINIWRTPVTISIITDPLPPFAANRLDKLYRVNVKSALQFINEYGIVLYSQTISDGKVRELEIYYGRTRGIILVDDTELIEYIKIKYDVEKYDTVDIISEFNENKKIARILYQFTLFQLSKFIFKNKIITITEEDVMAFSNLIIVIPNFKYDINLITSNFKDLSIIFMKKGKIICHNSELMRRLLFIVNLYAKTFPEKLKLYKDYVKIPNFINDITDFKPFQNQYILNGEEAVNNLIKCQEISYSVNDKIIINEDNNEYFFRNNLIDKDKIFLAVNTDSYHYCKLIISAWNRLKININRDLRALEEEEYYVINKNIYPNVYSYVNRDDIIKVQEGNADKWIALGYKINNLARYTALLWL